MNTARARLWGPFLTMVALTLSAAMPIPAQDNSYEKVGLPEDWTHHHVVFGDAGTAENALQNGTYEQWLKVVDDPRYQLEQARRFVAARAGLPILKNDSGADGNASPDGATEEAYPDLGIASKVPVPRGLTRAGIGPQKARTSQNPYLNSELEPPFESRHVQRTWRHNGAKLDWSETLGTGGSLGLGNSPAKFSFTTSSASCGDWVVYGTGVAGGPGQATIVAFTNLYSGTCSGSVPSVSWGFNTGSGSTVLTSPVLSLDGTQIAFVQNATTGGASLIVLKWSASGTLSAPTTLSTQASGSAYRSCAAPCMFSMNFSGGATDSGSPAWYDYGLDTVWVGDDNGVLHKFTGVFAGSPTEVTSGGWPVAVSASPLNGPIHDPASGSVFVGDYNLSVESACTPSATNSLAPCGFLYSYNDSTGSLKAKSAQLDYNFGIVGTPLLDQSAGQLYVPVGSDGEIGTSTQCGSGTPCAGVFQLPTNFSNGASGTEATVGPGYEFLEIGAFDNAYFTSANAASPSGHLYVVGNTGPANNTLYQISINANVMSTASVAGPVIAQNYTNGYYAAGLNVTEFFNGGADYIFLSTIAFSNYAGCGSVPSIDVGCVVGFNVTSGSISAATQPTGSSPAAGGASSIIVDNSGSAAGESNIYFSALANQTCPTSGGSSGCAIQISQSAP